MTYGWIYREKAGSIERRLDLQREAWVYREKAGSIGRKAGSTERRLGLQREGWIYRQKAGSTGRRLGLQGEGWTGVAIFFSSAINSLRVNTVFAPHTVGTGTQ